MTNVLTPLTTPPMTTPPEDTSPEPQDCASSTACWVMLFQSSIFQPESASSSWGRYRSSSFTCCHSRSMAPGT